MTDAFSRSRLLYGEAGMELLSRARVAVFGLGGVGGYVVEALARSGVGALDLVDNDRIALTNLNRQILATRSTLGQYKADLAAERVREINPECAVRAYKTFFGPDTADEFPFPAFDYVVDAIDTVTGKLELAERCLRAGTPIISCMGAGNKVDPSALEVADLTRTSVCPVARVMRRELKRRGIRHLKVVYSKEKPLTPRPAPGTVPEMAGRRPVPGSGAVVPAVAGLLLAGEVVRDLTADGGYPPCA